MNRLIKYAKILIIDDDEDDFIITSDYIKSIPGNYYTIDWCPSYANGIERLLENNHDLYFVDYRLGAKSGVDFLKEAQEMKCIQPIVLLTGKGNYTVDIQAMEYGAVDYLIKTDLTTEKMERCIRYALDRAATMQALRKKEKKYRNIFEKSKDVVFVTDYALNFIDVNNAVLGLLGFTPTEILEMNLGDVIDKQSVRSNLMQMVGQGLEINDLEILLITKSGEQKHCIITISPENKDGDYMQGIIHDITSLKKIEKATLQGEKLAAAGRLVRTIAHEVRNPLNNIMLSVEQMQSLVKENDGLELYMNIIHRNSTRINDLIKELLYTSRPTEHLLEKNTLQLVVDDVIAMCIDRLTLKQMNLQVDYPELPLEIQADREKLKLALLNIVTNAIEAMEESKGLLILKLMRTDHLAILAIEDNGCGISEENISRLFEPYFTQKRNGVGLGLTFTLNILQAHKATIDVDSKSGRGTTFTISFPLDD